MRATFITLTATAVALRVLPAPAAVALKVLPAPAAAGLGLVPAPASAQEPIQRVSMEEALRLFAENSLALRIARSEADQARGEARQSRAYFNPSATVVREDLASGDSDYAETIVGLEQRLEWPGRTAARARAAGRAIEAAQAAFAADSLRLAFDVRQAYAEAWKAEETEEALAIAAGAIRKATAAAERRYAEGDISGYQLRRLRVERARTEQALASAGLEARAARRTLAALVLPGSEAAEVGAAEPLEGRPPPIDRETALAAVWNRPDLEAAEQKALAADAAASAASQAWVPSPTVVAGYKDQTDGFSGPVISVALPVPLFDRQGGEAQAAAARRATARTRLELRRREARNDVLSALDRYASARERLETIADSLLAQADDLLEIARVAYAEGELGLVELLDAAEAFRDARVTALELRAETWIAYYDVSRATGRAPEEDR